MAKLETMEIPLTIPGPVGDLVGILKACRRLGHVDICVAEALGALLDQKLDDAEARKKARDWLLHEAHLRP